MRTSRRHWKVVSNFQAVGKVVKNKVTNRLWRLKELFCLDPGTNVMGYGFVEKCKQPHDHHSVQSYHAGKYGHALS